MKISTKEFVISSEVKNDKGFFVKTDGIDITAYTKNPLMLVMHQRPTGKSRDEAGVIGSFINLYFKDDKLMGTPAFDPTDDYALKLFNKVEQGIMRMVSAGLIPLKWGKDEDGNIWLLQCKLFEVSLVDAGSNPEAFAVSLYEETEDKIMNLSFETVKETLKIDSMKTIELSAVQEALGLSTEIGTVDDAKQAIVDLVNLSNTRNQEIIQLTAEKQTALDAKKTAEDALKNLQTQTLAKEQKDFVMLCVSEGKIVQGDADKFIALMAKAPEETKAILQNLPTSQSILEQLKKGDTANELVKLSYDELDKKGLLEKLKAENIDVFKEKFKAKFNKDYQA